MNNPINIFIDTEFTNSDLPELISIALVSEYGDYIYIEITDFPLRHCSKFVVDEVLPLLGGDPEVRMPYSSASSVLLRWLFEYDDRGVCILYDCETDWDLLFSLFYRETPEWIMSRNSFGMIDRVLYMKYFEIKGLKQHHALNDAQAMLFSYKMTSPDDN